MTHSHTCIRVTCIFEDYIKKTVIILECNSLEKHLIYEVNCFKNILKITISIKNTFVVYLKKNIQDWLINEFESRKQ